MSNPYMEGGSWPLTTRNDRKQYGMARQDTVRRHDFLSLLRVNCQVIVIVTPVVLVKSLVVEWLLLHSRLHRLFYELLSTKNQPGSFTDNPDWFQIDNNSQKSSVQSKVGKLWKKVDGGTIELSGHSPGKVQRGDPQRSIKKNFNEAVTSMLLWLMLPN